MQISLSQLKFERAKAPSFHQEPASHQKPGLRNPKTKRPAKLRASSSSTSDTPSPPDTLLLQKEPGPTIRSPRRGRHHCIF